MLVPNVKFYINKAGVPGVPGMPDVYPMAAPEADPVLYTGTLTRISKHSFSDRRRMEDDIRASHRLLINVDFRTVAPVEIGDYIQVVQELWGMTVWRESERYYLVHSLTHEPGLNFIEANVTEEQ